MHEARTKAIAKSSMGMGGILGRCIMWSSPNKHPENLIRLIIPGNSTVLSNLRTGCTNELMPHRRTERNLNIFTLVHVTTAFCRHFVLFSLKKVTWLDHIALSIRFLKNFANVSKGFVYSYSKRQMLINIILKRRVDIPPVR